MYFSPLIRESNKFEAWKKEVEKFSNILVFMGKNQLKIWKTMNFCSYSGKTEIFEENFLLPGVMEGVLTYVLLPGVM